MKKVELLSPAGNYEMLKSCIHNGADAVYLSGKNFGARKFANNFDNEELVKAINYAHLYGVKVYVTINTLIKQNEVENFVNYVRFLHKINTDAVLMQDLGMINLVRQKFPNLTIHASTQFHTHNKKDLEYLKNIGVKRIVFARELSIDEINKMDVDIEKEIFIHGALCIAYSGQCLMSSNILNRSGNRGECAGLCRLPYELIEDTKTIKTDGNYLLSTKELCTINNLKPLLDSNINSLKIEGRMKSPEYVGYVTKLYRKQIDNYYNGINEHITEEEMNNLKLLFNRDFTKGFILNDNENIINQQTPNHQGLIIGNIIDYDKKYIKIKLNHELNQNDAIRFKNNNKGMYINYLYDKNKKLINHANKDEIIYIDNKINISNKDIVLKTIDNKLLNKIKDYKLKKIPINIKIKIKEKQNILIEFSDKINTVSYIGNIPEKSINNPITKQDIIEKITKLGNSIYKVNNINIEIDNNLFIPIKLINEIRRTLIDKLNNKRTNTNNKFIEKEITYKPNKITNTNILSLLIDNELDYIKYNKNNIEFYTENIDLYNKYKTNNNIYLRLPRIIKIDKNYNNEKLLISDIGYINKYITNNEIIADIYSNVTNIYTIKYLTDIGIKRIGISPELTIEEINNIYIEYNNKFNNIPNIEVLIFGKLELMLLKHCILNKNINKSKICNICKNNKKYYIKDRNNKLYRIINKDCITKILSNKLNNKIEIINKLKINYLISLIDLDNKKIIDEIIEGLGK